MVHDRPIYLGYNRVVYDLLNGAILNDLDRNSDFKGTLLFDVYRD